MVLCLIVGCDSKSVRDKGLYSTRVPSVVTNQGEEAQKISKERRSREVNAFVIGFPEGGGDPGLMWGNTGTLQQISALVVGEMWGPW